MVPLCPVWTHLGIFTNLVRLSGMEASRDKEERVGCFVMGCGFPDGYEYMKSASARYSLHKVMIAVAFSTSDAKFLSE